MLRPYWPPLFTSEVGIFFPSLEIRVLPSHTMTARYFNKGDKLEVTRSGDSSRWFPATIIRPSSAKHRGQIYVEYETLDSGGEGGANRRREYISAANARPSLPVELHQYFKTGDKVDALHESAWRLGTVADILENSRYLVSFDGDSEEFEFDQWSLRVHRDWDDGSWVPNLPQNQKRKSSESETRPKQLKLRIKFSGRTSQKNFSKGTMVEVSINEEGYRHSWYTAVIVDLVGTDKFLVEYQTLKTKDETELLKENVGASFVRPCPPEIPQIGNFKQFQEVDAWFNDGWWVGHIFKVLDARMYAVQFASTNKEMTFEHSKLRPHQDWIDGKWVAPFRSPSELELKPGESEVKFKPRNCGRKSEARFSKGTMVEVKSDEEGYQGSWYTAVILGSVGKDKFVVEYQMLKSEDENEFLKEKADALCIRPCPPIIQRIDRFKLFEKVDAWYNDGWWVGLIFRVLHKLNYAVYFWTTNEELEFGHFNLRPHQEWIGGKWVADFMKKSSELPLNPRPGKLKRQNSLMTLEANYFSKGVKIEVKSEEDGYSGSWYPAVIIGSERTGKYLVEYRTLRNDNEIRVLEEEADAPCIRPCPPVIQRNYPFEPFEEVDVWHNHAWWVGAVSKVLQGSRYAVYIRGTNEVLEFQHSDLRPHQDWIDGKWVVPLRGRK